jgi:hypothetical protein
MKNLSRVGFFFVLLISSTFAATESQTKSPLQLGRSFLQILMDLTIDEKSANVQKSTALSKPVTDILSSAKRDANNWSGIYLSTVEGAYVFVVDGGNGIEWFMDTPCCTHAFSGRRNGEGVVNGKMFRREKSTACLTEYNVTDMKPVPGATQILTLTLAPIESCGIHQDSFTRRFERKW